MAPNTQPPARTAARPYWLGSLLLLIGCHTPSRVIGDVDVELTIEALYAAFDFDAGAEADWARMRQLFAEGAAFVAPIADDKAARAVDAETFITDFKEWIRTSSVGATGLHERIVNTRIERFGHVAHAWVTFEGFVPPEGPAVTRGVDSIQLVLDLDRWRVASFTSQFESDSVQLPRRFLRPD